MVRAAAKNLPEFLEQRIMPEPNSGCWLWIGTMTKSGYGFVAHEGKMMRAHRLVYATTREPIPPTFELHHVCGLRCCVNPSHLRPMAHGENNLLGGSPSARNARKVRCPRGHAYDYFIDGRRHCSTCRRQWHCENPRRDHAGQSADRYA